MRIGHKSYGFQFHFEITKDMIIEWLETGQDEIKELGKSNIPEKILMEADSRLLPLHSFAQSFFNSYLGMIETS
jgi:hypothetical protein